VNLNVRRKNFLTLAFNPFEFASEFCRSENPGANQNPHGPMIGAQELFCHATGVRFGKFHQFPDDFRVGRQNVKLGVIGMKGAVQQLQAVGD
jgi:hypothetical protein